MYVKRRSRYFLITSNPLDSFDEKHGRGTSPTLLIFQLHENRVRREETGTLLASSPRQTDKSFIATRQKNFLPLAPVVPSIGLIIESRCRRCNGFPGSTEMFLRIKIRKNRVAVNFLVYRFPVNKCFNVSPHRTPNRSCSSFLHPLIIISPPLSSRFLQFFFFFYQHFYQEFPRFVDYHLFVQFSLWYWWFRALVETILR